MPVLRRSFHAGRNSRIPMASAVMCKGRGHAEADDPAAANVHRLGRKQKLLLKTDGEPALVDLRRGVAAKLGLQTVPEKTPC